MRKDSRLLALFMSMMVVGLPAYFFLTWFLTRDVKDAVQLTLTFFAILIFTYVVIGPLQIVGGRFSQQAADFLEDRFASIVGGYRRSYLDFVVKRYREFDTRGFTIQGDFNLELEQVYVELKLTPTGSPAENPGQSIWEYLTSASEEGKKLVVIGAPGSGKTTLLRRASLVLAGSTRQAVSKELQGKIPIYLTLREHAEAIPDTHEQPAYLLPDAIQRTLSRYDLAAPNGWFRSQLDKGNCVVLMDGLDEVADQDARKRIVRWVEEQMAAYGRNHFIVSSRPHGYSESPLRGVEKLEIKPFTQADVKQFIRNWYLANEIMRSRRDDIGVRTRATDRADDLMTRLPLRPALAALAVNPLLVTMIATVHSYKGALPGRRVGLYSDIFDVFLSRRMEVWQHAQLDAVQILKIMKVMGYYMMLGEKRTIDVEDAGRVIDATLRGTGTKLGASDFLKNADHQSGLLLEVGHNEYAFAHLTFQEYLASAYIREDKTDALQMQLIDRIGDSWWAETIRLFAAQGDATLIIAACLHEDTPSPSALSLAIDCVQEAVTIEPAVRLRFDRILARSMESSQPEHRGLAAEAKLSSRLRWMSRVSDTVYMDSGLLTNIEYQLFLDQMQVQGLYFYPDTWTETVFRHGEALSPVLGMRSQDVLAFCDWLTKRDIWFYKFRIPNAAELISADPVLADATPGLGYFVNHEGSTTLYPEGIAIQQLGVARQSLERRLEEDLEALRQLVQAKKQLSERRLTIDELLSSYIPVGSTTAGTTYGRPPFGIIGREQEIEEYHIRRFRFQGYYKDDLKFAKTLGLDLDQVMQIVFAKFLGTVRQQNTFTEWLTPQPMYHCRELNLSDAVDNLICLLTPQTWQQQLSSAGKVLAGDLVRASELIKLRTWASLAFAEREETRPVYQFLRWYVRLLSCSVGAEITSRRANDASEREYRKQAGSACEQLILQLAVVEDRIRGKRQSFEGIRLVKVTGS